MLPLMVAMPGLDPVGGEVVEPDVEAGERADMGDAAAHLAGADHADLADLACAMLSERAFGRSLTSLMFVRLSYADLDAGDTTGCMVASRRDGQRPTLPSSAASSGNAWYRSATSP